MSEIKSVYTRQEITQQQVQNFMDRQNAIMSGKNSNSMGDAVGNPMGAADNPLNQREDTLQISSEAQMMFEQLERMREENEDSADMAEKQAKCMMIAMRIAAGDEVPRSDIKFLMKYNMGLYAKAMEMRIPKPDPEEHDSILSEEDKDELDKADMNSIFPGQNGGAIGQSSNSKGSSGASGNPFSNVTAIFTDGGTYEA